VTVTRSGRLRLYLLVGAGCLLAALILNRPEPVALAVMPLLAAALGLALSRRPQLEVDATLDRHRALEQEEVELRLTVRAAEPLARLELALTPPPGLAVAEEPAESRSGLQTGESRDYVWRLTCLAWGGRHVTGIGVRGRDALGLFHYRLDDRQTLPIRIYPRPEALRQLVRAADTQIWAGDEVSRDKGEGIEFADIRPFLPGDRVRRINWRVTARRGSPHVNELRPERNTDVVIFLDTFSELRASGQSSIDMAVRAALSLARLYLRRHDRVGLLAFGGTLRWLRPEMGQRQLYRIMDALIDTEVVLSYAWKGIEVLPSRTLPPRSLLLALSPLLDERSVRALLDLRARGHDVAVVEISPLPFVIPGERPNEVMAHRIWELEREAMLSRLAAMGISVATWRQGDRFQVPIAELSALRQRAPTMGRPA
jgi:uncharacterized protein (DUF58 family)